MLALGIAENHICSYELALSIMGVQCKVCTEEWQGIGSLKSKGLILIGACICLANIKKNLFIYQWKWWLVGGKVTGVWVFTTNLTEVWQAVVSLDQRLTELNIHINPQEVRNYGATCKHSKYNNYYSIGSWMVSAVHEGLDIQSVTMWECFKVFL